MITKSKKKSFYYSLFLIFTFAIICIFYGIICQAKIYEYFLDHSDLVSTVYQNYFYAQSFKATSTHSATGLKLWLISNATLTSDFQVRLTGTIDPCPSPPEECTPDLKFIFATTTIYASSINALKYEGYEYHLIFDDITEEDLIKDNYYALVFDSVSATSGTNIGLRGKLNNPAFDGTCFYSNDYGITWFTTANVNYFKIMGQEPFEEMATETKILIENTSTGATFYLDQTITYGDLFIIGFLILFTGIIIFKAVWDFVHPRIIKIKTKSDL